jgi:hypothetical protein
MTTRRGLTPVAMDDTRYIGTSRSGASIRLDVGFDRQVVARHIGIDQDIDGSWCVWSDCVGPGDGDCRPAEGSISIYDPAVAGFLEQLHSLLVNPVAFGHRAIGKPPAST